MRYVIIENGIVVNAIESDNEAWVLGKYPGAVASSTANIGWYYSDGIFDQPVITVPIANRKRDKLSALSAECQAEIYAGFTSTALGAEYIYPAADIDQQNLTASVLDSVLPNTDANWTTYFLCADSNGVWQMREHSAAQIQQVGRDGKSAILAARVRYQALAAQVDALPEAAAQSDFDAISWT